MRRVRYGVGMRLDGFVADVDNGTGWMTGDPGYDSRPFFASIDTVLIGRRSYEVMLRHGVRSYPGLRTYVFSRTLKATDYPEVTMLADDGVATVSRLRGGSGKDIWLSGGGELFRSLLAADLVDTRPHVRCRIRSADGQISSFNGVVYVQVVDIQESCRKAKELGGTLVPGFPLNLPNGTGAIGLVSDPGGHPVGMYSRTPIARQGPGVE
jgi:dihydrofolate reductase